VTLVSTNFDLATVMETSIHYFGPSDYQNPRPMAIAKVHVLILLILLSGRKDLDPAPDHLFIGPFRQFIPIEPTEHMQMIIHYGEATNGNGQRLNGFRQVIVIDE
jgi:hypothetical protein